MSRVGCPWQSLRAKQVGVDIALGCGMEIKGEDKWALELCGLSVSYRSEARV